MEYITREEASRTCRELKIRDWTRLKAPKVPLREAKIILAVVNKKNMPIDPEQFRRGLEVELEHGLRYGDANVTNNHPLVTGMIVLAHLKESLEYYLLLEVAELEGDLMKAVAAGNARKVRDYYGRLAKARIALAKAQLSALG